MINLFSLLFSTVMVMYVVFRAAKLDVQLPWFEPPPIPPPSPEDEKLRRPNPANSQQRRPYQRK